MLNLLEHWAASVLLFIEKLGILYHKYVGTCIIQGSKS